MRVTITIRHGATPKSLAESLPSITPILAATISRLCHLLDMHGVDGLTDALKDAEGNRIGIITVER